MKRSVAWIVVLGLAAGMMPGCFTAAKETVGAVQGGKGIFAPRAGSGSLAGYTSFRLATLTDESGGSTPPSFSQHLPVEFDKALADEKLAGLSGGKTLEIRGTIIHYEDASSFGVVTGPIEQVIVRAEMVDPAAGTSLGRAICIGRTTARTTVGVKSKAEGLARAFVKWIKSRRPSGG